KGAHRSDRIRGVQGNWQARGKRFVNPTDSPACPRARPRRHPGLQRGRPTIGCVNAPERHLRLLTETTAAVNSTLDLEEVLNLVAEKVAKALGADACFVYLYDERGDELVLR